MKCLVTGCAGFIGSNLTDQLLKEGHEVIGIDCFTDYYSRKIKEKNIGSALKNSQFQFIDEDLLDMMEYPEVDAVFHLAAQAGVRASWGSDFTIYIKNNIEATQNLLEWYKDQNLKKFVYSSSSSVYGDVCLPMHEDMRLQPVSPYGVTKLAAEHLCYLYWKNFGLPAVSLRYFTVYGPRQRPDMAINKFVTAILNEKPITLYGDGNQTRDFTFVSDIVDANILAAIAGKPGSVFNIGGGSRITVNDLITELEKNCGKLAKIQFVEQQKGDVKDTLADIRKTETELEWKPRVLIQDGARKYVQWYLQNVH
ncbi:MAG: GDP-mannose 4,6-dehydratase [Methanoregula sp.]|nr:GDP-mannose 4,6-dehydratase [Methanoregula sp.]